MGRILFSLSDEQDAKDLFRYFHRYGFEGSITGHKNRWDLFFDFEDDAPRIHRVAAKYFDEKADEVEIPAKGTYLRLGKEKINLHKEAKAVAEMWREQAEFHRKCAKNS